VADKQHQHDTQHLRVRNLRFDELDAYTLYTVLKLRVDVFVVEQDCPYPELDGRDNNDTTRHILGYLGESLVAYARILGLPDNTVNSSVPQIPEAIYIGRVVVCEKYRAHRFGSVLMQHSISFIQKQNSQRPIRLSAQVVAQNFYRSLGFEPVSAVYSEDGIEHIDMQLIAGLP
jgi:ElaA protein